MAVGTHQIERRLRHPRARQFRIIDGIWGNHVNAQQLAEIRHFLGRRLLPEHDQVEPRVVEFLEQVLDRPVRLQLEPQPREAIARARRAVGQACQRLRQRALRGSRCRSARRCETRASAFARGSSQTPRSWPASCVRSRPASQLSDTTSRKRGRSCRAAAARPACARLRRSRATPRRPRP